jgi:hypothetical protein
MRLAGRLCKALVLLAGWYVLLPHAPARAQSCGCGPLYVRVADEAGEPVEKVTVEIINPESGEPGNECFSTPHRKARRVARRRQSEFLFGSWEVGPREPHLLRVTAPGFIAHEETGRFLNGCGNASGPRSIHLIRRAGFMPEGPRPRTLFGTVREFDYRDIDFRYFMNAPNWNRPCNARCPASPS